MTCNCCGAKWNILEDGIGTEKCPICNTLYSEKPDFQIFDSFVELSVMLYNRFGKKIFEEKKRVESYLNDYFPGERDNWMELLDYLCSRENKESNDNSIDNHFEDKDLLDKCINDYLKGIQSDNATRFQWFYNQSGLKEEFLNSNINIMQNISSNDEEKMMTAKYAINFNRSDMAIRILDDLQNEGNDDAKLLLAELYGTGNGVDVDFAKSSNLLLSINNKNNPLINFRLGYAFHTGRGVDIDLDLAKKYYSTAVSLGSSNAAYCLYKILLDEDTKSAMEYLKKAAEMGNEPAEYEYAIHFLYGEYIEENINNAVYFLEKAVEHGNRDAIEKLIYLYKTGTKVKQDFDKVRKLEERMF